MSSHKTLLLFFLYTLLLNACGQEEASFERRTHHLMPSDDFVFKIKSDNEGVSPDTQFRVWAKGSSYRFDVDCNNDGVWEILKRRNTYICNYSALGGPGTYTIRVRGIFPVFKGDLDTKKIISVEQWGSSKWTNLSGAFKNAENLTINAQDTPNLQHLTSLAAMFENTKLGISGNWNWDTSKITDMSNMFSTHQFGGSDFNGDVSNWNTHNVKNFKKMFFNNEQFNQDLSRWDTSEAITMSNMFRNASSFNSPLVDWDVGKVQDFESMFSSATSFNRPLWKWDTSSAQTLSGMFSNARVFNQPIGSWDISKVTTLSGVFYGAEAFNQPIENWNTSKVTTLSGTFSGASAFNQPLGNWDTSKVETLESTFANADSFNGDISSWNTGAVKNLFQTFKRAKAFNQSIDQWNVSNVTLFQETLSGATVFDRNLSNWNIERAFVMNGFLKGVKLSTYNYDSLLKSWINQNVKNSIKFDGGNSTYCLSEVARASLISDKQWTFVDGGKGCNINVELDLDFADQEGSVISYRPKLSILGTLESPATIRIKDSGRGSATLGVDYQPYPTQVISIPAGTYTGNASSRIWLDALTVIDDDKTEADESIILELDNASSDVFMGDTNNDGLKKATFIYTIVNDDICTNNSICPAQHICNLTYNPARCQPIDTCGNSILEKGESCDDGNNVDGDGCDLNCKIELQGECTKDLECATGLCDLSQVPGICEEVDTCGNGKKENDEFCDDGNNVDGDGCNAICIAELDGECQTNEGCTSGLCDQNETPPKCESPNTCGNGVVEGDEDCDDGNIVNGDSCTSTCITADETHCIGDRNCPEDKICNANHKCEVECKLDNDCKNEDAAFCQVGNCVECVKNTDCDSASHCDRGACIKTCKKDDDCEGKCSDGICVECTTNEQCDSGVCDLTKQTCGQGCDAAACEPSSFCSSERGSCVECLVDEHCLDHETCKSGHCDNQSICDPQPMSCENLCEENEDCKDARRSFCTDAKVCRECKTDANCGDEVCNESGECVAKCTTNSCDEDKVCNTDGQCVGCLDDSQCGDGICNPVMQKCELECQSETDCTSPAQSKCANNQCVQCEKASHCKGGEYCTEKGECTQGCFEDADCGEDLCNIESKQCYKKPLVGDTEGCSCSTSQRTPFPFFFFAFLLFGMIFRRRR